MSTEPKTILISRKPGTPCDDAIAFVRSLGGVPLEHDLGSVPAVDFEPLSAALIVAAEHLEAAAAQTNRWRVELGDRFRPILWILDSNGDIDGRADACLVRPLDIARASATFQAFERIRSQVEGLRERVGEANATIVRFLTSMDDSRLSTMRAYSTLHLAPSRPREIGALGFGYFHDPDSPGDPSLLDVGTNGRLVRIVATTVEGDTQLAGCLHAMMIRHLARAGAVPSARPGDLLRAINRHLLLIPDEARPVRLAIVDVDSRSGEYCIAQAGTVSPTLLRADGTVEAIPLTGPHLGLFEIEGLSQSGTLRPGERLIVGTEWNRATDHRDRSPQELLNSLDLRRPAVACAIAHLP